MSPLQKHVYYFIDFVYYVENGGGSGFLYNKSPTALGENNYQPYIDSLNFFNQSLLSERIQEFNDKYQEVFKAPDKAETISAQERYQKSGLSEVKEGTEQAIDSAALKEQATVMAWIEQNSKELLKGL